MAEQHDTPRTTDPTTGWQPIETAPKDGTHVLVCQWPVPKSAFGLFMQRAAWWSNEYGVGGWVVYSDQISEPSVAFTPTHWMPLPDPPTEAPR